ncbi:MAG: transglycosylase domain-containing protein [Bacilli bacterium]
MKKIWKFMKIPTISLLILLATYFGLYGYAKISSKLPIDKANSFYLYDINNSIYTSNHNKEWIPLNKISKYLINATISIEDKHFYNHIGFDYLRIGKSLITNFINGKTLQGASTITQQYAKNLFLSFDKNWSRKIEEAWLTIKLESRYSKDEILEGYLNTINYGGVFGIENASKYYFNKNASDLTLAEATILAGIPKSPTNYSPVNNEVAAKNRQLLILNSMVKNKYVSEAEKTEAHNKKLTYNGYEEQDNLVTLMYYQDAVMDELSKIKSIPASFLKTGGLKIYTNLDMQAQKIVENSIKKHIDEIDLQTAIVLTEPNSGKVLALAGGKDYNISQYNRAISSKRQVGSTMKPFLYYAALENGFTPSSTFTSEKTTFVFSEDKTYSPKNYNDKYGDKAISMASAIAYSDNIYAVKTHLFLGESTLVDTAKRLGIKSKLKEIPSLALGTIELNIMEMMTAYNTLANEGYKNEPYFINKVEDMYGNILYKKDNYSEQVLNKSLVYVLNDMLTNTYSNAFIDYNYPTCINISARLTNKYAIKTGTTNKDHLIFGYNKDLLVGIWLGYDDNRDSSINTSTNLKNIWVDITETYFKDKKTNWYDIPTNVVGVLVDPISGTLATNDTPKKKILYYIKGTEPYYKDINLDSLIPTIKEEKTQPH